MKRKLTISLVEGSYQIKSDDDKVVLVKSSDLIINAKDLYEQFFVDAIIGEPAEVEVSFHESATVGVTERKICEKVAEIINAICEKINEKAQKVEQPNEEKPSDSDENLKNAK